MQILSARKLGILQRLISDEQQHVGGTYLHSQLSDGRLEDQLGSLIYFLSSQQDLRGLQRGVLHSGNLSFEVANTQSPLGFAVQDALR